MISVDRVVSMSLVPSVCAYWDPASKFEFDRRQLRHLALSLGKIQA